MHFLRFIVAIMLSCFSTAIMSYITMAIPIGPWIDTTLVLCGMIIFGIIARSAVAQVQIKNIGLSTAAGGIGGILATGIGFSFPTLYFVDPQLFQSWINSPVYFAAVLSILAFASGSFGLVVAHMFERQLISEQQLPFPIGELVYKMIAVKNQVKNAALLAFGFVSTTLFLYLQMATNFIAQSFTLVQSLKIFFITLPTITLRTDLIPMFWSVGFITGHVIAVPLLVGFLIKIFCLEPIHLLYSYLQDYTYTKELLGKTGQLAAVVTFEEFSIAFCSGMVLYGVILSFFDLPKILTKACTAFRQDSQCLTWREKIQHSIQELPWLQMVIALSLIIPFLTYFNFSFLAQVYLLAFTFLWTYQVLLIAGKIGLAPLGRFATFVMVPGMFLFGFTMLQVTIVATFVEVAIGVASDVLFGRKMAHLAAIERKQIVFYQWLGLLVSSLIVGAIFWLLIYNFGIGTTGELPVNKAYTRALLINLKSFDFVVLVIGMIAGYLIKFTRISPPLILGGILMPPQYSLILIAGGLSTYLVKEKENFYSLASGIFAANSLWMLIKTVLNLMCTR